MVAPGVSVVPVSLSAPLPPSALSLFHPFSADPGPSAQVPSVPFSHHLPSAPAAPVLAPGSSFSSSDPLSFAAPSSSAFVALDELPVGAALDALPPDDDSAVPDSVRSEFRRMLAFLVDLFPQAAGSHSSPPPPPPPPPPPRALFEDFLVLPLLTLLPSFSLGSRGSAWLFLRLILVFLPFFGSFGLFLPASA